MKVLLTGATGFIGSHVARELRGRGHEVHALVRPGSDRRRLQDLEGLRFHEGRIGDVPVEPDVAIHLAWFTMPGKYLDAPENRILWDMSCRFLEKLKCRAVFAGTCFEYATSDGPLREDSPTKPTTLYAEYKDKLRQSVEKRSNSAWLRLFPMFGPWEDKRRLVPSVIQGILRGEPVLVSPGTQRRDFLYVEDVASAICAVAESSLAGCVNVGSGQAYAVRDVVHRISDFASARDLIRLGEIPYPPDQPMLLLADNRKLQSTGWALQYDLDAGLRKTFEWWKGRS